MHRDDSCKDVDMSRRTEMVDQVVDVLKGSWGLAVNVKCE